MPSHLADIIYLTNTQLNAIRQYLPERARLHHLPNPVDRTAKDRVRAEENDTVLFLGRLSPEKGAELAAKAARAAGVKIAFAGDGDCKDLIKTANPDAEMLGWLKPDDVADRLQRARCIVFPSLWYEGYPMSVVEALQLGVPVITSDRSAGAELVRNDVDGLHARTGDVDAWVSALRLCREDARIARYSRSSFEGAIRFLDTEAYRNRLLEIYTSVSLAQHSRHNLKL